jgi:hypothetical protein
MPASDDDNDDVQIFLKIEKRRGLLFLSRRFFHRLDELRPARVAIGTSSLRSFA